MKAVDAVLPRRELWHNRDNPENVFRLLVDRMIGDLIADAQRNGWSMDDVVDWDNMIPVRLSIGSDGGSVGSDGRDYPWRREHRDRREDYIRRLVDRREDYIRRLEHDLQVSQRALAEQLALRPIQMNVEVTADAVARLQGRESAERLRAPTHSGRRRYLFEKPDEPSEE